MKKGLSKSRIVLVAFLAMIAISASCTKKDNTLQVETPSNPECPEGTSCVPDNGPLPGLEDGAPCTSHKMCHPGSACIQNVCVKAQNKSCSSDLECPEFDRCIQGKCAECGSNKDCNEGLKCNSHGVCVPEKNMVVRCESVRDCGQGEICRNGICHAFCTGNTGDCNDDGSCVSMNNMLTGICVSKDAGKVGYSCSGDTCEFECDEGKVFLNGTCYKARCTKDSQCDDDKYCADGRCKPKECKVNDDCKHGVCNHFVCECQNDAECGEGYSCSENQCKEYECNTERDCWRGDNQKCVNHVCVDCVTNADCSDGKSCIPKVSSNGSSCLNGEWDYGEIHKSNHLICAECTKDSDCPSDKPSCDMYKNICVECSKPSDCKEGFTCNCSHQCKPMSENEKASKPQPTCHSNAECDADQYCSYENKCAQAAKKCTSDDECDNKSKCNKFGFCTAKPLKVMGMTIPDICTTDEHCGRVGGSQCSPTTRQVYDPTQSKYIEGHRCAYLCKSTADCEDGMSCIMGECIRDMERTYCDSTKDCSDGKACNTFYHECVAQKVSDTPMDMDKAMKLMSTIMAYPDVAKLPAACMLNSDCQNGLVCHAAHQCGCISNAQCGAHQICNSKFTCECTSDEGCANGFVCIMGESFEPNKCSCTSDEVCGEGKICNSSGACVEPDAESLYEHGKDYLYGLTRLANMDKAIQFFNKADSMGNPLATLQLALLEKDAKKANTMAKKAFSQLDEAEKMKKNKTLSEENPIFAIISMLSGSDSDIKFLRAQAFIRGIGVKKDPSKGISILSELAEQNNIMALAYLVDMYVNGKNVAKNMKKAAKLLDEINGHYVNAESGYGYYQLAMIAAKNPDLFEDSDAAREAIVNYLEDASKMGNIDAKYQYSAFDGVEGRHGFRTNVDAEKELSHAAKFGHEGAAKRLQLVKEWKKSGNDLNSMSDDDRESLAQDNAAACDYLRKQDYDDLSCASNLSKQGLIVGDYILLY